MTIALIDSDSICYAAGFASQRKRYIGYSIEGTVLLDSLILEKVKEYPGVEAVEWVMEVESEKIAQFNVDAMLSRILDGLRKHVKQFDYKLYLTGEGNFRNDLATIQPYKGNRVAPRPFHFDTIRQHLVEAWGARVVNGIEADDKLCMDAWDELEWAWKDGPHQELGTTLCHIDKDIDQVPGWHYSWQTHNKPEKFYFVTEEEARQNFWTQVLIGDTSDNILGIPGIGKKKAAKILDGLTTEKEYYDECLRAYQAKFGEDLAQAYLHENASLLYLLRSPGEGWRPPQ